MSKSALQRNLAERELQEERIRAFLSTGKKTALDRNAQQVKSFDTIVSLVKQFSIVTPVREINTFNRSLKTNDVGKQAIAIASHLYGKYKVPAYLTNAWNFISGEVIQPSNAVERFRNPQGDIITAGEIGMYCKWYTVAASGGSLWKYTKSTPERKIWKDENGQYHDETIYRPMFTKKENHAFLNCPIKNANVRQAIIYAVASGYNPTIGQITRLCKSKIALLRVNKEGPIEFYTRPIWREVIHFFIENEVPINELNDLLDYIQHAIAHTRNYSLKGRTLATIKGNMQDWHWELNRVKKMGNADWSKNALPVPNESFEIPQTPNVIWTMNQLVTSKELAAEGTSMHHCVYGYQARCVRGSTAIWSLKKEVKKKGYHIGADRALTIEMNTSDGTLVQIRGFANRTAHQDEMAAVRYWAGKHNFRVNHYS